MKKLSLMSLFLLLICSMASAQIRLQAPWDKGSWWQPSTYLPDHSKTGTRTAFDFNLTASQSSTWPYATEAYDDGRNIRAAHDGTVKIVRGTTGYGNYVTIQSSENPRYLTLYAHLSSSIPSGISNGSFVKAGDIIGFCSNSGLIIGSGGHHLHFELRLNGVKQPLDGVVMDGQPLSVDYSRLQYPNTNLERYVGRPIEARHLTYRPNTSPSIARLSSGVYGIAFQANNGNLYLYSSTAGPTNTGQGMMAGTSPSIAASSRGGFQVAFQANNGFLYTYDRGPINTGQGMMAGTSPSIAALSSSVYGIAFQANNGNLYLYSSTAGPINTGQGMMAGTSPSIAATSNGGFRVAFQANNGFLYTYDRGPTNTGQGMMAGTSPSIAFSSTRGFQVAFQANNGFLYTYDRGPTNTGQGMMAGTSPAITALSSGGYAIAFQAASSGYLYTYAQGGPTNTSQGMMAGTSPSIAASSQDSFQAAFEAASRYLYVYSSPGGPSNTNQGM